MITLKNMSKGPRGILMQSGKYEFLMPGEQKTIDGSKVRGIPADVVEGEIKPQARGKVPEQPVGLEKQATGEKLPYVAPTLSEMTRAELEEKLRDLGIDLEKVTGTGRNGSVVMADIRNAIEAHLASSSDTE